MKAIRVHQFGGPEVMKIEDVPDPTPGSGQVCIRIKAIGVNPADTYIRAGVYPTLPALPYTPGFDGAGIIESVGDGVKRFQKGDRVYLAGSLTGTYAELAVCNEAQVHPLPERASFSQGASIGVPCATAYRALFHRAQARPAEKVLVHGATGGGGSAPVPPAPCAGFKG